MPKHNKIPHRRNIEISPRLPHTVQNRMLREQNDILRKRFNKMNRLLWTAIQQAGGRVEIANDDYTMAMQMADSDCGVSVEVDEAEKKVILILVDEEGKPLEQSEKKLIIEL